MNGLCRRTADGENLVGGCPCTAAGLPLHLFQLFKTQQVAVEVNRLVQIGHRQGYMIDTEDHFC